jgi:hypothetical protein
MAPIAGTAGLPPPHLPGRFDLTPLVTLVVTTLVVRFVLRLRLTWPMLGIVLLSGIILGWAIQAWGVLYPSAVAFAAAVILTAPLHRRRRGEPWET